MILGNTYISATPVGFLVFGFSYKNLVFNSQNGVNKTVQGNDETKVAYFCEKCESTFIKNQVASKPKKVGKYTYEAEEGDDLSKIVP